MMIYKNDNIYVVSSVEKSDRKNKKLKVTVLQLYPVPQLHTIHFGDLRYEDFTTHNNEERRKRYIARASRIKKDGSYTINDPLSANYWAARVLWDYDNFWEDL